MSRCIVVTGGPGSGKTSLIEALSARGHASVPEAALLIIEELNAALGVEEQKRWRRAHVAEFQTLVAYKQLELQTRAPREGVVFFDRGLHDGLAYCEHFGLPTPALLEELGKHARYDAVLLLDTLTSFQDRGSSGRTSDRAASLAIAERLEATYRAAGFEPLRLPELALEARVQRALELLGLERAS